MIFIAITYQPLSLGEYIYPYWCQALGWTLSASLLLWVPFWMIVTSYKVVKEERQLIEKVRMFVTHKVILFITHPS